MRITDLKVQVFQHPVAKQWRGPLGGQMVDITLATLTTDQGMEGYSMGRANGGAPGVVLAEELAATAHRLVVGKDLFDRELIWQEMWSMGTRGRLSIYAIACVDVALWDLAGKALGSPVYKLLGACRHRVPAYASSGHHATVEAYVEEAMACQARGYAGYKIHPFGQPERDVEVCRAVRRALGDGYPLMIDPAGAYDHRQAMWVGRRLEEIDYYWYEDPIGDYDVSGYAELCRSLDIPVMPAEMTAGTVYSAAQFLAAGAMDIMRADVYQKGGITPVMKMAHLAEAHGLNLELHHGASALMNWANLHCLGAFANGDFVEILVPEEGLDFGLQRYANIDDKGYVNLSDRPGLGAEIDWEFVNAHTVHKA